MKKLFIILFSLLVTLPLAKAQADKWEELGERLAEKAERIAENAEAQVERNAARWEAAADKLSQRIEREFDKDWTLKWRGFPRQIKLSNANHIFLGVEISYLDAGKARKLGFKNIYGSYVTRVIENSTAARAGLQPFDYIYGVNDQRTSDNQDLVDILDDYQPGDEVTLYYVRNGKELTTSVVLEEAEDDGWEGDYWLDNGDRAFLGVSEGIRDSGDEVNGVTIEVVHNSTAGDMGLEDGDIITTINGHPILDWDDLTTAIQNTKAGDDLELTYYRDGQLNSAKGTLMSYNEVYADDEIWAKADNYVVDEEEVEVDMDRAFLGVFVETLSKEKARKMGFDNPYGSFVTGVIKNSAAAKAGLQPFDYIFGIDEYRVGENQSLGGILTRYHPGDEATIHFIRKRKKNKANLTFGTYFKYKKEVRNSCEDPFLGINQMSNEDKSIAGVRISPVEGTTAEEMGLQKGDIIQTINDYTIVDWDDVKLAIDMMNPGETITVKYLRDGVKKSSSKPIKSYAETKNCDDCDCGRKKIEVHVNDAPFENLTFSWRDKSGDEGERDNLEGATISVEDVTAEEMQTLQQKGIITEAANNLEIRKMRIAPDAAAGLFQISFELSSSGDTQVRVHNSAGRTIYEYDLGEFSGEFSDEVDISQNGPGNYYLQIRQDGKSFTKKIVLAKD